MKIFRDPGPLLISQTGLATSSSLHLARLNSLHLVLDYSKNKESYPTHPGVSVGVRVMVNVKVFVIPQIFSKSLEILL